MGKRKEIKFMCRDGRTFEGRQDGVLFWIRENRILRQRGMVEEVTTAMERRRQAHGRA